MKKSRDGIDAVHLMRTLRDALSEEMQNMSYEQQKAFISKRLAARRRQLISAN